MQYISQTSESRALNFVVMVNLIGTTTIENSHRDFLLTSDFSVLVVDEC